MKAKVAVSEAVVETVENPGATVVVAETPAAIVAEVRVENKTPVEIEAPAQIAAAVVDVLQAPIAAAGMNLIWIVKNNS